MMNPSIYAHTVGGGIFIGAILYLGAYFSKISSRDSYQILVLILLFSIAMSIHGISHMGLEYIYHYNPYYLIMGKPVEGLRPLDFPCPYRRRCNCPLLKTLSDK
jgi:hypothetical protein